MMIKRRLGPVLLLLSCVSAACRSAPAGTTPPASAEPDRTYNVITRQELSEAALLGSTAFVAVQRLRPSYLIDKTAGRLASSQPLQVSVNEGRLTDASALNSIPVTTIAEIRYFTTGDAAQHFRNRSSGPVILVTLLPP